MARQKNAAFLVQQRDRKGSIETTQAVEEQEALRKKEKLKGKRHQAYLRRTASGWQRQYE